MLFDSLRCYFAAKIFAGSLLGSLRQTCNAEASVITIDAIDKAKSGNVDNRWTELP